MSAPQTLALRPAPSGTSLPGYSVLIRTYDSETTLPATLDSLTQQTLQPAEYVFVDSGSTDSTLSLLPAGSILHRYAGDTFNFSEALNQGLVHVTCDYLLIISSHSALAHPAAIEQAVHLLETNPEIGAVYFSPEKSGELTAEIVDRRNFNGFNGLWNTCSIVRVPLLRERQFRPEVFSAEDQEWAGWLIHCRGMATARIDGAGLIYNNPRQSSMRKRLNEYTSIAWFTNRRLLAAPNLLKILWMAVTPAPPIRIRDRQFHLLLLLRLIACRFREPKAQSRYF